MGRGDRRHYNIRSLGGGQASHSPCESGSPKVVGVKPVKSRKPSEAAASQEQKGRIIFRDSRCPGCHGRVTLKYQVEKVDGSFRYHLMSPSIAHTACEGALEEIRKANPAWFRREINAKD